MGLVQASAAHAIDLDEAAVEALVRDAVARAGGFEGLIRGARTVVLKPNLVAWKDGTLPEGGGRPLPPEVNGVTTDWRVTRAVARMVRELAPEARITVMEGAAGDTAINMARLHYDPEHLPEVDEFVALETASGAWQDFDAPELVEIEQPEGLLSATLYLNRQYWEADVLISLPVLKNHCSAVVTGAVKNVGIGATPANIYGMSEDRALRMAAIDHTTVELHWWIHDFYLARPVDFAVMDGLQGVQNGPNPSWDLSGATNLADEQHDLRLVLASADSVALDTVAALVMAWDPETVEHLRALGEDDLGEADAGRLAVAGVPVDAVREVFAGETSLFAFGGAQVEDFSPPALVLRSASVQGDRLYLTLDPDDAVRLEVALDSTPLGAWPGAAALQIPVPEDLRGAAEATVTAYDRFHNRCEASAGL